MTCLVPRKSLCIVVCLYGLCQAAVAVAPVTKAQLAAGSIVVMTDRGAVRGLARNGVREFKGIPYAAAPVGVLRWQIPQERRPWAGILDATKFGNSCPQAARYGLTEASYEEDCLSLNITIPGVNPIPATSKKLPVLVWIYGGAFVGGSSALYPLDHMAKIGNVIVVSINYRIGVLGFMAHPAFDRETDGDYGQAD